MPNSHRRFLAWLRDAHAMEEQSQRLLEGCGRRIESYPEFRDLLVAHAKESQKNAAAIAGCLERHGDGTSGLKDVVGKFTATAQSLSGLFVGDEVMKALMAIYTFEHMKISAYRILVAAAERFEDQETQRLCGDLLIKEEAVAETLKDRIPNLTTEFLAREERREPAKH